MNKFLGGSVLILLMAVIIQQLIYGSRVDPDSIDLPEPDTVVVRDTCWLPDTSGWVEGGGTQSVNLDSLAEVWKDEWLTQWLAESAGRRIVVNYDTAADSSSESQGLILPSEAEMASLDTTITGLCRFRVDYLLPPYDLWRVQVSERFQVNSTVTISQPYPSPVYPNWSVEAMLVGGKSAIGSDKYRVGFLGGIFHKRTGLVFGLDTQGYWLGASYCWRLGKGE